MNLRWETIRDGSMGYPVLIDDIDDDDELSVVLSIVYESNSPNLHISLERLQSKQGKGRIT